MTTPILPLTGTGELPSRALTVCCYEPHPVANLFPVMDAIQLAALTISIKAHGLVDEIVLFESGKQPHSRETPSVGARELPEKSYERQQ